MIRTALITGASRGLGGFLAEFLAKQDYRLIITSRGADDLEDKAEALRRYGADVTAIAGDVGQQGHRQMLAEAAQEFGGLDLLVNNASTLGVSPLPHLSDYPLEELESVLATNLIAPISLVQILRPFLKKSGGLVVNISSDAAIGGYEGWGGYGLSKAALDLASLTLANELRNEGIGVVSVDPGDMRTSMHQAAFPGEDISDRPLPESTLPFWAWLLNQESLTVSGNRYQAQSERWEVAA